MHFKFIDLFAGIGGFRIALEKTGGKCVFSSEYDRYSQLTYEAFFGEKPVFENIKNVDPPGDITKMKPRSLIPDHDILAAGFPCQPFSLAGVSKKQSLGRPHGFDDPTQGTLFYDLKEIIAEKKPKAFILENVKNLKSHNRGQTFKIIVESLQKLDYEVAAEVIDAANWVPQHRERIFIVGFRRDLPSGKINGGINSDVFDFGEIEQKIPKPVCLSDILEENVDPRYTLGPGTWDTLERHKKHHEEKGQGFGYGLLRPPFQGRTTRTLSARYHKDGAEILIDQGGDSRPRRLSPLECCRLMGFPLKYQRFFDRKDNEKVQPVSDTQAYRQFGNSVAVPVVSALAKAVCTKLEELS